MEVMALPEVDHTGAVTIVLLEEAIDVGGWQMEAQEGHGVAELRLGHLPQKKHDARRWLRSTHARTTR